MAKFEAKSFHPQAFANYVSRIPNLKRNEMINAKALRGCREIREAFHKQSGTAYALVPLFGSLDGEPLNYDGKTDMAAVSTDTYERGVIVTGRMKAWVESDFSEDITGGVDFMDNVAKQVAKYWDSVDQDILLSILQGIFSMTGAENLPFIEAHTMDITQNTGEENKVSPTTLNSAIQKACGDNKGKFSMVICHSTVATNLENLNLLSYLKYTDPFGIQRDLSMATWNGRSVLVDDSMPSVNEDGQEQYTTYLLGEGAFDYENIGAKVAFELSRDPKTNGGQETLYSRERKVFAPCGISYKRAVQASLSPTNEELANGANWEVCSNGETGASRKTYNHKAIPIARIISRG